MFLIRIKNLVFAHRSPWKRQQSWIACSQVKQNYCLQPLTLTVSRASRFDWGYRIFSARFVGFCGVVLVQGSLVSLNWVQVFEACDCLKLLSVYFKLCVDATGVFCHRLAILGTDLHACMWRLCRDVQLNFSVLLPLLLDYQYHQRSGDWWLFCLLCWQCPRDLLRRLTWSFSRNTLKRVGESRHPCRTPTVGLSRSPMLPLKRTALVAFS